MEILGSTFNFETLKNLVNNNQRKHFKVSLPSQGFILLVDNDSVLEQIINFDDLNPDLIQEFGPHIELQNVPIKHRVFNDTIILNSIANGKLEPLFKVKYESSNKELYQTLHYFLTHGPVINAPNFHVVTPYLENLVISIGDDIKIKCCLKYQLWIQEGLYFQTNLKTLTNLRTLTDYLFVPELTKYQLSDTINWSTPTVSSFYSTITQNTNLIANDPDVEPFKIEGIEKTLLPFQFQSLNWLLKHEGVLLTSNGIESLKLPDVLDSEQIGKLLDQYSPGWTRVRFSEKSDGEEEVWFNQFNGGIITTKTILKMKEHLKLPPAKAFLCEEMGLGKTLEVTALVNCHPRTDIQLQPKRDPFDRSRLVTECKTTLILCPETIISQWVDEIEQSSNLSVFVYNGVMIMEDQDTDLTPSSIAQILSEHDIVLTSYNILARELDRAIFKPTERPKRLASGGHERIDYSSPLMLLEFYRLVLDEAQLATISMSKVAKFSRILPRVHTWCVSGTLIRKNLHDLLSLLKSQRLFPLDLLTSKDWDNIPRNQFDRLIKERCLRHTKQMVGSQVELPNQTRILLRSPFSNIEWDNYSNLYSKFLQQVGLNELGEPTIKGFDLDKSRIGMRKWSGWLRMVCCHALLLRNFQEGGASSSRDDKKGDDLNDLSIGTLDVVLKDLIKNTEMEIYHHDSSYIRDEINIGKIWEFLREPSKSKSIFETVIEELKQRIKLFKRKVDECSTKIKEEEDSGKNLDKTIWSNRLLKCHDLLHQSYFMLASAHYQHYRPMWPLPDTFEELKEKTLESETQEEKPPEVETLTDSERIHYDLENDYYQKADDLINQILEFPLNKTREMISKMSDTFSILPKYRPLSLPAVPQEDNTEIPLEEEEEEEDADDGADELGDKNMVDTSIKQEQDSELYQVSTYFQADLVDLLKEPKPSLGTQFTSERAINTIEHLDKQSDIINKWFTRLVELQSVQVTRGDEDATGSEYANSLAIQEESQALIDQIPLILKDRERALNSTEAEIKTLEGVGISDDEGSDREWIKKKKKRGHQAEVKPITVKKRKTKDDEHTAIYIELDKLRKYVMPEATELPKQSLKTGLLELTDEKQMMEGAIGGNEFFSNETLEYGIKQLSSCIKSLKSELGAQNKRLREMKSRLLNGINDVFNSKIGYYKALQSRSDELVKYSPQESSTSPQEAARKEMNTLKLQMVHRESKVRANKARLNYLKTLSNPMEHVSDESNQCIICQFTILVGTLTPCGHKYCRDCLGEWVKTKSICPMCKKALKQDELYHFVTSKGGLKGDFVEAGEESTKGHDSNENDEDFTDELNKLRNRRILEKDLNIVYSSIPPETLNEIGSIKLTKSYGTKVDMILRQVKYLRNVDPHTQILVFSQWNRFLTILARAMKTEGIIYKSWTEKNLSLPGRTGRRINPFATAGNKSRYHSRQIDKGDSKLDHDIAEFKTNDEYACFLLNTVAQAAGLTFTNASHVFLCEPLVNLSFELQAVSRIHRIGQVRETKVWNFVIDGTIEESIAYLGTKKRLIAAKMRSNEVVEIDEDELEAKEMTKVNEADKKEGEIIDDDDLWAAFFATKDAKVIDTVYK